MMKPKFTDEEKKELIQMCIGKLNRCNELLDEAFKHHCISSGMAANDSEAAELLKAERNDETRNN